MEERSDRHGQSLLGSDTTAQRPRRARRAEGSEQAGSESGTSAEWGHEVTSSEHLSHAQREEIFEAVVDYGQMALAQVNRWHSFRCDTSRATMAAGLVQAAVQAECAQLYHRDPSRPVELIESG